LGYQVPQVSTPAGVLAELQVTEHARWPAQPGHCSDGPGADPAQQLGLPQAVASHRIPLAEEQRALGRCEYVRHAEAVPDDPHFPSARHGQHAG
jgi:hypothetical protein